MIRFSFSSFYMSMIFSNIVILFLYIVFKNQKLMIKLGLPILSGAVLAAMLRMVLPIEFLFLSHNIYFPKAISKVISDIVHPYFGDHFSFWSFVKIVWIVGIILFIIRYLKTEYDFHKDIGHYSKKIPESAPAYQIFKHIQEEFPKTKCIELRTFPFAQSPFIYGMHKPYILLPEELELDDKQLYYILRHEISHYLHHDFLLKLGVEFLCIAYWWNPLCRFLKNKADMILEMRIDQTISKDSDQRLEYFECLLFVANHISEPSKLKSSRIISFCDKSSITLKQRFEMLMDTKTQPFSNAKKYIFFLLLIFSFILSYVFIFEASYIGPKNIPNNDIPSKNNSYFIEKADDLYDLYINGKYIITEYSLKYYPDDIPVYREEVKTNETY